MFGSVEPTKRRQGSSLILVLVVEVESAGREKVSFSEIEVYNHDLCPKLALTPFRVVAILSVSVCSAELLLGSYV